MLKQRSQIHMLTVAAARLEADRANPALIQGLRSAIKELSAAKVDGRGYGPEDEKRIERQRTLFATLPSSNATDRLKLAIQQRAYDLMWDGFCAECDALLEFLPSKDADEVLNAWDHDQERKEPPTKFYDGGGND